MRLFYLKFKFVKFILLTIRKSIKEQRIIQEQIIELLPIISDVNAIAEELNKHRFFEVILVPTIAFEDKNSKSQNYQKYIKLKDIYIILINKHLHKSNDQNDQFTEHECLAMG